MMVFASTTFLPGRTSLARALDALRGVALDGVELGSTHFWSDDLAQVARGWTGAKVAHNYFPPAEPDLIVNIASSDPEIRSASCDHAKRCLQFASEIGASVYTVHPGFVGEAVEASHERRPDLGYDFDFAAAGSRSDAFVRSVDALSELSATAARLGVRLAVETEGSLTKRGVLLMESPAEWRMLLNAVPQAVGINLNFAHTGFAAVEHGFAVRDFITEFRDRIVLVELSDNDGQVDLHRPLRPDSPALEMLGLLPDVPLILEFRDATAEDVATSADLVRNAGRKMVQT